MNLFRTSAAQKSIDYNDDTSVYQTQFEFMSFGERLQRINRRIENFRNRSAPVGNQAPERCTMVYFSIDAQHVTEARHLIISLCKDKLIFMRIKPNQHSSRIQVELFLNISFVQRVQDLMKLRFHC